MAGGCRGRARLEEEDLPPVPVEPLLSNRSNKWGQPRPSRLSAYSGIAHNVPAEHDPDIDN